MTFYFQFENTDCRIEHFLTNIFVLLLNLQHILNDYFAHKNLRLREFLILEYRLTLAWFRSSSVFRSSFAHKELQLWSSRAVILFLITRTLTYVVLKKIKEKLIARLNSELFTSICLALEIITVPRRILFGAFSIFLKRIFLCLSHQTHLLKNVIDQNF